MPADKFGNPYFYPTKSGGYNYEMSSDPKNDQGMEGLDSDFSVSGGIITMKPNGPTSFSVGRNCRSFSDSIGGCNMDFLEAAHRGYTYKADDVRDLEFKCLVKFNIGSNGFSISACTGHHTSSNCCQGFAYMFNLEPSTNPTDFRFRKEMWHVSYSDSPEQTWNHSKANFKIDGSGKYIGLGFCRYNKPVSGKTSPDDDHIVLEGWFNPDPEADRNNWIMLKRIEDFVGNGWGNDGDDCGGAKDQSGPWSGAHNRLKTNASSGTVMFKEITFREIDPFGSFDTTPPPTGGGGSVVSRDLTYAVCGNSGLQTDPNNYYLGTIVVGHEIVEALTDPDPLSALGPDSWWDHATGDEIADPCGGIKDHQYGTGSDSYWLQAYWSNSDNNCVVPRVDLVDLGSSSKMTNAKSGPVLANAKIFMIFWGSDWQNRTTPPTGAGFIDRIKNRLLGTDKEYFARLTQYDNVAAPTWGNSCYNTSFAVPSGTSITETQAKNCIIDTFNRGLLPIPQNPNEDLYILMIPIGKTLTSSTDLSSANGLHDRFRASLTIPPPIIDPPPSGGCPAGTHLENGVCISDTVIPPPTPTTSRVHGFWSLLWDINTVTGSGACTGTGGGGGGPSGDLIKIYDEPADEANERALSDTTAWKNRKRVTEQIMTSDSVLKGQVVKQFDVPLKKAGSPVGTVFARIWSSSSTPTVLYTSPTTFDPSTFTTSFVTKTFDFSTNTHAIQVGERIGIEYQTTSDVNFVRTSFDDNTTTRSEMVTFEGSSWNITTGKDIAATMWA